MKHPISASVLALSLALIGPAAAQSEAAGSEEKGVPIVEAPYHLPVFSNEYITLLKIFIPPGRNTGFHTHSEDSISVNIVPAIQTNQNLGSSEVTTGGRVQRGRIAYTAYSKEGPRTHKATNIGDTPFHNVSFLFRKPAGAFTPGSRANASAYRLEIDNERVRGWRLVLEPGQSAEPITQEAPGLRVVIDGGEIVEQVPGRADRGWMLASGEFYWQEPGQTRAIRNIGSTRIEIVEFELK